ncbi:hypothetical protein F5877DRAFT_84233 [Lentinula edodes]|nr:hypothetical protein F5877DRAFT_84233 [Lentinula edodes]
MTGSFSLLFLLFFKYGHGPIVSNSVCRSLLLLVLIYTSTVAVSFYIQVPQTSATIIGATTGSVVAVHAGDFGSTSSQAVFFSRDLATVVKSFAHKATSALLIWAMSVISSGTTSISTTSSSLPRASPPVPIASGTLSQITSTGTTGITLPSLFSSSASDLSRIASSSDLTTLPFLPTSSVGTGTDTLSSTSTMISSSSPSAKSSSGNGIYVVKPKL